MFYRVPNNLDCVRRSCLHSVVRGIDWDNDREIERKIKAFKTAKNAKENKAMNRSECSWEFDAWRDIFSEIRDDPLLAMDKQEVLFLDVKDLKSQLTPGSPEFLGKHTVQCHRIPDCTFGFAPEQTPVEPVSSSSNTSSSSVLRSTFLKDLFRQEESALISDPKWFFCGLVFPWALYEAKKSQSNSVIKQVQRASEIYLNMLHDLVLEPGHHDVPRPYQNSSSSSFQVFAMTSEGPDWKLYVCYRREVPGMPGWLPDPEDKLYAMKQIWEGDITNWLSAWQLHFLVDQIHAWAVGRFRNFIIRHLQPWHQYLANQPKVQDSRHAELPGSSLNSAIFVDREAHKNKKPRTKVGILPASTDKHISETMDENVSQREYGEASTTDVNVPEVSQERPPWWLAYSRPGPIRQRLLQGEQLDSAKWTESRKRRVEAESPPKKRKRKDKLREAYIEQEKNQEEDLVLNE